MFNPFRKSYSPKEEKLFDFLLDVFIFRKLNYRELSYFSPYMYLREYKNEEVIFFREDPSNAIYIIKTGKVTLSIDINDGFEKILALRAKHSFGENALLQRTRRNYNAIATTDQTQLYVIPKVNILEIFEDHARLKSKMMEAYSEMNELYTSRLLNIYQSSMGFFTLGDVFKIEN